MSTLCYIGGGWGDSIQYVDDKRKEVYGFKSSIPRDGSILIDLINSNRGTKIPVYLMVYVKHPLDTPRDMFKAKIRQIGYIESDGRQWTMELTESRWLLEKFEELNKKAREDHKKKY